MTINSRQKGAQFERQIAQELFLELGITFRRDLDQYRQTGRGDLIADTDAWPFLIECKRYASGNGLQPAWREQATRAAEKAQKWPCVIFRYDRAETRVALPVASLCAVMDRNDFTDGAWMETDLPTFCTIAREGLGMWVNRSSRDGWKSIGEIAQSLVVGSVR